MGNYTPEQVEECAEGYDALGEPVGASMLRAYAATLRQQAGRVDEGVVDAACAAFYKDMGWQQNANGSRDAMRAALTAALAQNTQGEDKPALWVEFTEDRNHIRLWTRHAGQAAEEIREGRKLTPYYLHAERARVPEDTARLDYLIAWKFVVGRVDDEFMLLTADGRPVTGGEHPDARAAIDEGRRMYPLAAAPSPPTGQESGEVGHG